MSCRAAHPRAEAGRRAATRPLYHTYTRTRVHGRAHVSARSHTAARSAVAYAARRSTGCPVTTYFSEGNTEGRRRKNAGSFDLSNHDALNYKPYEETKGSVGLNSAERSGRGNRVVQFIFFSGDSVIRIRFALEIAEMRRDAGSNRTIIEEESKFFHLHSRESA